MPRNIVKQLTTVFFAIAIPVFIVAGIYGFAWWKVSTAADNFSKEVAPFASMTYEQVHIDLLEAEVGLKQLVFKPVGMEGDILLDSVVLRAPSWGFIFELQDKLDKGELPESFNLDIKGLKFDLQSGYMQDWGRMMVDVQREAGASHDALACGQRQFFTLADFRKMGYQWLSTDILLQYYWDTIDQRLNFDFQSKTARMADVSVSTSVGVSTDTLNLQSLMFAQPQLKRMEVRYYDRGYNDVKNRFCAKESGVDIGVYRENYNALLAQRLKLEGWVIPEYVMSGINKLNEPAASFYARVDMPQGFGMQSLVMIQQPSDLITHFAPYVEIQGKPVSLDGLNWAPPDATAAKELRRIQRGETIDNNASEEQAAEANQTFESEPSKQQRYRYVEGQNRYLKVELDSLTEHIGRTVVLYTYYGREVQGRLMDVGVSEIIVERRLEEGRGTATYPIARDKVQSAHLYLQ